ncbi:MAG: hypothetical protein H6736_21475 [Alphaproteobacteria bacterium]|nr:hypothetical protein [Alphaproteobacteria bacterium]
MDSEPPADHLVPELYAELRQRASRLVAHLGGAVAPTSLVHEALEKLFRQQPERWVDASHFRATASLAMRQILADRAKAKARDKRGGTWDRVTLSDLAASGSPIDAIAIHDAMSALEGSRPRCAEVARLRLLGGMELAEIAAFLDVSMSTVTREWRVGRAFIEARLTT